jgi:DGQHR domain-containing protein
MIELNIDTNKTDESSNYYCIHSVQKLNSKFNTHVLSTNVPIKQILKNRDIYLVDDLRGDAKWSMNKIIQRNISSKRVSEITNEYLKNDTRLIKFFPAITVVLLPKSDGEPLRNYERDGSGFNKIKGIKVDLKHNEDHFIEDLPVEISWDKNKISALVIDGQHRVSAIRKFYDSKSEESYIGKSIPVSFIIFHNTIEIDLIQATRALFIDVNNTPRLVSEEKLIFIDDRNLHRRITLKAIGGNDPEEETDDVYQKIYDSGDLFLDEEDFINTFFIEEAGNDDESRGGLFATHNSLMPWEFSKLMTIHKNILADILLKYINIDKSRDIRSFCKIISNDFLSEIEGYNAPELLTEEKTSILYKRMTSESISKNEIEVFRSLISLREKYVDNLINIRSQFMIGTSATQEEKNDRDDFIKIITNIYNKDCSKDSYLEF